MTCREPLLCAEKVRRTESSTLRYRSMAQGELEDFQEALEEGEAVLTISSHALERQVDRSISRPQIVEAVKNGWAIERRQQGDDIKVILLYHLRVSPRVYRPIHIVAVFNTFTPIKWTVKTVYDPRSEAWKWSEDFQRRVCFCQS